MENAVLLRKYVSISLRLRKIVGNSMFQRVQFRLYSGAQYALCGRQHCNAPDPKQRSVLCNSLGRQAGGLLCVTWPLLLAKFLKLISFPLTFATFLKRNCFPS